jgi:hypothetical protein
VLNAIRLKKRVDSETLYLPELKAMVGKEVEIIVLEGGTEEPRESASESRYPLRGWVFRFDDPLEPVAEGDWEAMR